MTQLRPYLTPLEDISDKIRTITELKKIIIIICSSISLSIKSNEKQLKSIKALYSGSGALKAPENKFILRMLLPSRPQSSRTGDRTFSIVAPNCGVNFF